jgi:hypothetical protein
MERDFPVPDLQQVRDLGSTNPDFPVDAFHSGASLRRWTQRNDLTTEAADLCLRPILQALTVSLDTYWREVLFYLFWPDLGRTAGRLRRLDRDPDRLGSQTCWAFVQCIHRIDVEMRLSRLGLKILNDVQHDVRSSYSRDAERNRRCISVDVPLGENGRGVLSFGTSDIQYAAFDLQHDRSWAIAKLRALVRSGQLARADFLILVGCHLYGRGLEEMAARLGLNYEAAKKRRQRAVNHLNKFSPGLSPDCPESPLMSLSRTSRKERPRGREL